MTGQRTFIRPPPPLGGDKGEGLARVNPLPNPLPLGEGAI